MECIRCYQQLFIDIHSAYLQSMIKNNTRGNSKLQLITRLVFRRIKKVIKIYLIVAGVCFNVFIFWMVGKLPIYFDLFLIKSEEPIPGEAIVCIAGGMDGNYLPSEAGWQSIYTAVQLYFDSYAPNIIFTGGGTAKTTEAEVYAEVAQWLGCPEEAMLFDPNPHSTAEHPLNILKNEHLNIDQNSALNIVTSALHSRRTAMCFKKNGFTNFRMIIYYSSKKRDPTIVRSLKTSRFETFRPSKKKYDDIFMRLRQGTSYFFTALRELAAIMWYKLKGYV